MSVSYICTTCGTQFSESESAPKACPICLDPRQYVNWGGQEWTTLSAMKEKGFHNEFKKLDSDHHIAAVSIEPNFAIGQRALLIRTHEGNILWDCVPFLKDEKTLEQIEAFGGIDGIAISHPHYYTTMAEWAGYYDCPVYLHQFEQEWVMRPNEHIEFWQGDVFELIGGLRLLRLGGHFKGGQVLYWPNGAYGKGALLTGDIIQVVQDRDWVSFMYSYPNQIPLPARHVEDMYRRIENVQFDRIYGAWTDRNILEDAKVKVARSADRYLDALDGIFPDESEQNK